MTAVESAREALLTVIEPLRRELGDAKSNLLALENELKPLEEALQKLDPGKKAKSKASKPCARKQDVMQVCLALVEANQPIVKDDLVSLVKHKLAEEGGFSLSGVSLRLAECLASDEFATSVGDTIKLAAAIEGAA